MRAAALNRAQYFDIDPVLRQVPIYCVDAGSARIPPGSVYPLTPERHPLLYRNVAGAGRRLQEYQIVFISEGRGVFEAGEPAAQTAVTDGTLFLLRPGEWHRYAPERSIGWQEYWVGFEGPAVATLWSVLQLPASRACVVDGEARTELIELFERVIQRAVQPDTRDQIHLAALVQQLLALAARITDPRLPDRAGDRRFERAREAMLQHIHDIVDASAIARAAGCSRSTLQRLFRVRVGMSPYRYFLSLKIDAAKWLLARTDSSIKEIAREYGFSDQYHFSRVFRDITGTRPSEWRRTRVAHP